MGVIVIKASRVEDNKNGTFSIEFPSKELSKADHEAMDRLFPNLKEAAWGLLNREALLSLLATDAETMAKPSDTVSDVNRHELDRQTTKKAKY